MKYQIISILSVLLFITSIIPVAEGQSNNVKVSTSLSTASSNDETGGILKPEDEGDHFPCGWELWCVHASLVLEDGQNWDAAATMVYLVNKTRKGYTDGVAYCRIRHWNRQTGEFYDNFQTDDYPGVFQTEKNNVNVTYRKNYICGLFPNYIYHCEDEKNKIITNLNLEAKSSACWLYQESTGGILPWGISGTGKAYFIPILHVTGNISINGTMYNLTGIAYHEHDIGFFDFSKPYVSTSIKDTISSLKAMKSRQKWSRLQVKQNQQKTPFSIHFSNDYLFGWNWGWMVFNNNFSIVMFNPTFYGISQGNVPGFLYFSKDGINYTEIGCIYWNNCKEKYIERADIYIPLDFEMHAYRGKIQLHLKFNATTEITELYSQDFASYYQQNGGTFFACGNVEGYYIENEENITLNGFYQLDQTRWLPKVIKHRSLDVDLILPPNGLGIAVKRVSHRSGFERYIEIQLRPKFEFTFYIKPVLKT